MFKAYDADGNGYLEPHEVLNVFRASLISKGVKFTEQELQNTVAKIFQEIDVNKVALRLSACPHAIPSFFLHGASDPL